VSASSFTGIIFHAHAFTDMFSLSMFVENMNNFALVSNPLHTDIQWSLSLHTQFARILNMKEN